MYRKVFCFVAITMLSVFTIHAQQKELDAGIKYEINNITVAGAQSYNEQTVIAFTGLKKGERIFIPGERLSEVTKKLWEQNLFSDIAIYVTKIEGELADLEIYIEELPKLDAITISGDGIRKTMSKEILKETELKPGLKITKNLITTTKNFIRNKFVEKGFYNTDVIISTLPKLDSTGLEIAKDMHIVINKNKRVKISPLEFEGNDNLKDGTLRSAMKNTKKRNPIRIWKMSKFTDTGYEEDKASLILTYKESGYRDAKIINDSVFDVNERNIGVVIKIDEGKKYYFGAIRFLGNSVFTD
ncbi:MAG: outer membrane protein insertion porin family, partial [Patiriisocius sp.]